MPQPLPRPSNCSHCLFLHELTMHALHAHRRETTSTSTTKIPVLSWCCVCGIPVALEVHPDYRFALHEFIMLDRQHRPHRMHVEDGGWGVHWRLDEVLEAVFPGEHVLPRFIRPPWYEHREGLEFHVRIMTEEDKRRFARQAVDQERRMLDKWINSRPRSRDELQAELSELGLSPDVWTHDEADLRFEVLYFVSPFVAVVDRKTREKGSLMFQHEPRLYFGFDSGRVV